MRLAQCKFLTKGKGSEVTKEQIDAVGNYL